MEIRTGRSMSWQASCIAVALLGAIAPAAAQNRAAAAQDSGPSAKWEGFYAGGSAGYRKSDSEWTTTRLEGPPLGPFTPNDNRHQSLDKSGLSYGLFGGYNWAFASDWLVGIEGRVGDANTKRKTSGTPGYAPSPSDSLSIDSKWDASAALRIGYLPAPDILLYGAGGVSHQKAVLKYDCLGNFPVSSWCVAQRDDKETIKRNHWTIGGGAEMMFVGNWILRLDYRYAPYSDKNVKLVKSAPVDSVFGNLDMTTHTVSVGAAYKF
jgi:outer membrane immunogenic protein